MSVSFTNTLGITLTLRNPEFGDQNKIDVQRVVQKTRGGFVFIIGKPYWAQIEYFNLSFKLVSYNDVKSLIGFLFQSVGQYIGYTDQFGNVTICIINDPSKVVVQEGRSIYTVSLDLQRVTS